MYRSVVIQRCINKYIFEYTVLKGVEYIPQKIQLTNLLLQTHEYPRPTHYLDEYAST